MPTIARTDTLQFSHTLYIFAGLFKNTSLEHSFLTASNKMKDIALNTMDDVFNEAAAESIKKIVNKLKEDIENNKKNYEEITLQSTALDYTLWNIKNMNSREFIYSYNNRNEYKYPSLHGMNKWANMNLVPTSNESNELPTGYKTEIDEMLNSGAKYSIKELDEAFVQCNIHNIVKTGMDYYDEIYKFENHINLNSISSEEEEKFRESLIAKAEAYKDALVENINNTSTSDNKINVKDSLADRLFTVAGEMENSLGDDSRSFRGSLTNVDEQLKYLKSGLPLSGMHYIVRYTRDCRSLFSRCSGKEHVNEELKKATENLYNHVKAVPEENASDEAKKSYCRNIANDIEAVKNIYDQLDKDDQKYYAGEINGIIKEKYAFNDFNVFANHILPYRNAVNHYADTFNNTFKGENHNNSEKYVDMVDALNSYKEMLEGTKKADLSQILNALEGVQNTTDAYIKDKSMFEGWKGDGGVRYDNAKALNKFASYQIKLIKNNLSIDAVNKSVKKTDLSSMMDKLEMNTINKTVKRTAPTYKYTVNENTTKYWNMLIEDARQARSAFRNSRIFEVVILDMVKCREAASALLMSNTPENVKKYSEAVDKVKKSAKRYEDYKLSDHTRFSELEPGKKKLNSSEKDKLKVTDTILYHCPYATPNQKVM
ncbi:MAG: hypothetical protein K6A23_07690 [Butyrivibrio sp.]|nr:hypothetical protein [Butyrivibrio sp.]